MDKTLLLGNISSIYSTFQENYKGKESAAHEGSDDPENDDDPDYETLTVVAKNIIREA